jgi:hypothetical protein
VKYIASEIDKIGLFEVIYGGDMNSGIPALCWTIKAGTNPGFSLYDLSDRLRSRGWQVPAYTLPANCRAITVQRVLVRHGVTRDRRCETGDLLFQTASGSRAFDRGRSVWLSSLIVRLGRLAAKRLSRLRHRWGA